MLASSPRVAIRGPAARPSFVIRPSSSTTSPFTSTYRIPTGASDGFVIVPRSAIVAASNTTMSATFPGATTPRSAKPRKLAVAEVIFRIASGSDSSCFSRT